MSRILSGIQPSGDLHLGNYLGAIQHWIKLQERNEVFFMVADLHAITVPYEPKNLPTLVRNTVIEYLAAGLDPKKATIFIQSHIPAHSELMWLLSTITNLGSLLQMTQLRDKLGRSAVTEKKFQEYLMINLKNTSFYKKAAGRIAHDATIMATLNEKDLAEPSKENVLGEAEKMIDRFLASDEFVDFTKLLLQQKEHFDAGMAPVGLVNYPILQAADILAYKPESVPVGEDQDQHIELSRDLAKKMNRLFGTDFPEPKSLHTSGKRIMDLVHPEKKMSKSLGGGILLNDSPEIIEKKLKKAVSSAEPRVIREAFKAARAGAKAIDRDWKGDENLKKQYQGVRNLFTILLSLGSAEDTATWETQADTGDLRFAEFKPALTTLIANHFAPFRERRAELVKDKKFVDEVITEGAKKASAVAEATLLDVQQKMGLR